MWAGGSELPTSFPDMGTPVSQSGGRYMLQIIRNSFTKRNPFNLTSTNVIGAEDDNLQYYNMEEKCSKSLCRQTQWLSVDHMHRDLGISLDSLLSFPVSS